MAGSHGHFELNVFKPLIIHNILQSIDLLADSSKNFAIYCIKGIKADKNKIKEHLYERDDLELVISDESNKMLDTQVFLMYSYPFG